MNSLIHVGNTEGVVKEVSLAILSILSAPHADEKTKVAALAAVGQSLAVSNVAISNMTFTDCKLKTTEEEK
tara:strand:- start:346 stop:558 length:213 start_codon:yes stop_codon:yes gene_type:complete